MATDKKGFLLYAEQIGAIKKLVLKDREQGTNDAGELFLHILEYVNDTNPEPINFLVDMAFEPIKMRLKNDLKKYETYLEKQSENGKKGGRPKKEEETQKTQPFIVEPKKADTVTVTVTDVEINKLIFNELIISESWIEVNAKNNKITVLKTKDYLHKFNSILNAQMDKKNNRTEYTTHFARWLPLEIEKDKKTNGTVHAPLKF